MFSFANPKYLFGCGPFSVLQSENENENNEIRAKIQMYLFLVLRSCPRATYQLKQRGPSKSFKYSLGWD